MNSDLTIEEIDISVRTYTCLKRRGLNMVSDVVSKTEDELLKIRSFGIGSLRDLKKALANHDLALKED